MTKNDKIVLHVRITGKAKRFVSFQKFIRYVGKFYKLWIATREEIARYWIKNYKKF